MRERIRSGKGRIRKMGADYLVYALLDAMVDNHFIYRNHFYPLGVCSRYVWNEFQVYAGTTMAMGLRSCFADHGCGGRGYVDIF